MHRPTIGSIAQSTPAEPRAGEKRALIKAIDFCCGAGGLTRGLLDAGIAVVAGVDNDERLRDTYERNNEPSIFVGEDLEKTDIEKLRKRVGIEDTDTVLYAACTPCQPFSSLNRTKADDARKSLLLEFAEIVEQSPPDFVIVENVPGLNNAIGSDIHRRFAETLESLDFHTDQDLLDAKHFGVPQTRKRFILIASRHGVPRLPVPTTADNPPTVREYIENYPRLKDGEKSGEYPNHAARDLPDHHKRIVEAVPLDGGSRRDVEDKSILLKCHRERPDAHKDVFGRIAWDAPGPTLTCRCTDVYCGRFIHPEQHRGLSLREAAALQTFKDDYEFCGKSFFENARQIGNAVPVSLARELGQTVIALTAETKTAKA